MTSCAFLTGYVWRKQQSLIKRKSPQIRRFDLPGCRAATSGDANLHRSPTCAARIQPLSMRICVSSRISLRISGETRLAAAGLGRTTPSLSSIDIGRNFEPPIGGLPKTCLYLFSTIIMAAFSASVPPTVGMTMSCAYSSARSILSQLPMGSSSSLRLSGTPAALLVSVIPAITAVSSPELSSVGSPSSSSHPVGIGMMTASTSNSTVLDNPSCLAGTITGTSSIPAGWCELPPHTSTKCPPAEPQRTLFCLSTAASSGEQTSVLAPVSSRAVALTSTPFGHWTLNTTSKKRISLAMISIAD